MLTVMQAVVEGGAGADGVGGAGIATEGAGGGGEFELKAVCVEQAGAAEEVLALRAGLGVEDGAVAREEHSFFEKGRLDLSGEWAAGEGDDPDYVWRGRGVGPAEPVEGGGGEEKGGEKQCPAGLADRCRRLRKVGNGNEKAVAGFGYRLNVVAAAGRGAEQFAEQGDVLSEVAFLYRDVGPDGGEDLLFLQNTTGVQQEQLKQVTRFGSEVDRQTVTK